MLSRRDFLKVSGLAVGASVSIWASADELFTDAPIVQEHKYDSFIAELKKLDWIRDAWIDANDSYSDVFRNYQKYVMIIAYSEKYKQQCNITVCVSETLLDDELVALCIVEKLAWDEMSSGPNDYHSSRVDITH